MTKQEDVWTRFGVPAARLADLDNLPAPNALAGAFGDRYLYRHNPVYASVRDAAVGFGYRFSAEDTPLWRDYQSFGLTVLHRILTGKTIPYLDTAATFRRLVEDNPGALLPPGLIAGKMMRNHAFHEPAHCVAHSIMQGIEAQLRAVAPGETERTVLDAILAESSPRLPLRANLFLDDPVKIQNIGRNHQIADDHCHWPGGQHLIHSPTDKSRSEKQSLQQRSPRRAQTDLKHGIRNTGQRQWHGAEVGVSMFRNAPHVRYEQHNREEQSPCNQNPSEERLPHTSGRLLAAAGRNNVILHGWVV